MIALPNPFIVILGGSLTVTSAAALLYAADRRARAASQRIASVTLPIRSPASAPVIEVRRPWKKPVSDLGLGARILSRFGIETDRPDLYPAPWWIVLLASCGLAVAGVSISEFFIGSVAWFSLPLDLFMLVRFVFRYFRQRRSGQLYTQLPDALAMAVRSVRAGFTVGDALRVISEEGQWPTSAEFRRVIDEVRLGNSLHNALMKLAQRSALLEYRFLAVALALQNQSGGSLSETLENLADVVRKRVALKQRGMALSAEARMTMYVLGCLPFLMTGALMVLAPSYLTPMVTTPGGKKLLFAGIVLLCMGFASMQGIIKKSLS